MKIAIYGYGNLGRGVEAAALHAADVGITGIFTRRDPSTVKSAAGTPVYRADSIDSFASNIDVVVICGGSATYLPVITPELAGRFCVVDSFDTHAKIPDHFAAVDASARSGEKLALISAGWDPGLFSLARVYSSGVLPDGSDCTFWGKGVSQGHSDAIRRIDGVLDARQYTIPIESAVSLAREGKAGGLKAGEKHRRQCFVVLKEGADAARVEKEIREMPNYFADYETEVNFITKEEMERDHSGMPHGGFVVRTGKTGYDLADSAAVEFSLRLDSNPGFTGSVLVACARAVDRMFRRGERGCITMMDIAPADLSPLSREELRRKML